MSLWNTLKPMSETHTEWFKRVTRNDSNRRASELADISPATLGRQLKAGELSADLIIKIAQAYDESPVVALVDLGFISAKWMQEIGTTTALTRATDEELTDELLRRLKLIDDEPVDQLAAKRSRSNIPPASVEALPYAANRRKLEPEDCLLYTSPSPRDS